MTRLVVENHWDPARGRWMIDAGDLVDIGSTADVNLLASAALVTAAGRDFVEIHDPSDRHSNLARRSASRESAKKAEEDS